MCGSFSKPLRWIWSFIRFVFSIFLSGILTSLARLAFDSSQRTMCPCCAVSHLTQSAVQSGSSQLAASSETVQSLANRVPGVLMWFLCMYVFNVDVDELL